MFQRPFCVENVPLGAVCSVPPPRLSSPPIGRGGRRAYLCSINASQCLSPLVFPGCHMTPLEVSPSHHPRRPKRTVPPVSVRSRVLVPVSVPLPWLRCKDPPVSTATPCVFLFFLYYDGTPLPPFPTVRKRGAGRGPDTTSGRFRDLRGPMIQGLGTQGPGEGPRDTGAR